MTLEISVILPARNEAARVGGMLRETLATLQGMGRTFEVLLIDDHSTDATARVAAEYPDVRTVRNDGPAGKGSALRKGAALAQGMIVVFLDADGDLPPSQLPAFLEPLLHDDADVLTGSKHHPESDVRTRRHRRIMSTIFVRFVRHLFALPVRDTQTGLKAFSRAAAVRTILPSRCNGYGFDLEVLRAASQAGLRILERPVIVRSDRAALGALRPVPLLQAARELVMLLRRR